MSYYTSKLKLNTSHAYNSYDYLPPHLRNDPKKALQRQSGNSSAESNSNKRQRTESSARRNTTPSHDNEYVATPARRINTTSTARTSTNTRTPTDTRDNNSSTNNDATHTDSSTTPTRTPTSKTVTPSVNIAERSITAITNILTAYNKEHSTTQQHNTDTLKSIATDIESELSKRYTDDTQKYRQHVRDLCMNLKQNINLCYKLLNNELTPHELVYTDSAELATDELKQQRTELNELSLKIRQADDGTQQRVDDVKCIKCGNMGVWQTQSNVALTNKSDTWGNKDLDATNNYTCITCGYKWQKLIV